MRGTRFFIPNEYNKYLWEIFKFVDLLKYTWYISQEEILYFNEKEGKVCSDFFTSHTLTGSQFKECINKTNYYLYSVNIQAYPIGTEKEDIFTYDDFIKSKCEILLLCADAKYVDLYSKDEEYLKNIYDMCIRNKFENVEYITHENDERTGLRI